MGTPYQRHKFKWSKCQKCVLHETRRKVVLARGKLPAAILFIGEAPGASEDVIGKPFVGPAGKLLDRIIERGIDGQYDYVLTNLVACIPKGEDGNKMGEPSKRCILACLPRLKEFIELCKPRVIVSVGRLAGYFVPNYFGYDDADLFAKITHPAAILRMDVSRKGLAIKRCVITLEDVVENLGAGE